MLLLVDNHDSFTHNLAHLLAATWEEPEVRRVDTLTPAMVLALRPRALVLSPGPGRPRRCRGLMSLVAACAGRLPILGVCLGHQAIGEHLGLRLVRAPRPVHGHAVPLRHSGQGLFAGCPQPMAVARYHSLVLDHPVPGTLPCPVAGGLVVDAVCEPGLVMALRHDALGLWGLQFHPESFLCQEGPRLLAGFRRLAEAWHPSCSGDANLPH